ncbi:MAG: NHL repeat-containing protein [Pseudomonadota bacterium]
MRQPRAKGVAALFLAVSFTLLAVEALAVGPRTEELRHLFDITGGAAGPLALPADVAVSVNGRAYVVDSGNHRVVAYGPNGQHLFSIGRRGSANGEFKDPLGIGTDRLGRIYVADKGNRRIQIFDAGGAFIGTFPVSSGGKPVSPSDVAPNADGRVLYVTAGNKIMVFTPTGTLLREWGGNGAPDGETRYPGSITVSPEGLLLVVDTAYTRVQVFEDTGRLISTIGEWGSLPGQFFRPAGIALDSRGYVYVADNYQELIEAFDTGYRFSHILGAAGQPYRFTMPGGIAIDPGDRLYVVETLANKVSVFSLR